MRRTHASFSFITSPAHAVAARLRRVNSAKRRARPLVRRTSRHRLARHDLEWLQLTSFRRIIVSWEFPQKCCMPPRPRIAIERKLLRDLNGTRVNALIPLAFDILLEFLNLTRIHINTYCILFVTSVK